MVKRKPRWRDKDFKVTIRNILTNAISVLFLSAKTPGEAEYKFFNPPCPLSKSINKKYKVTSVEEYR